MSQPVPRLYSFPPQTRVGRPVPKARIYERGQLTTALRDQFVAQLEQITWACKLAPETLNLPARSGVPEIQVFDLQLKGAELDEGVLRAIDRAIPFPIIFQLHRADEIGMVAALKRPSQAQADQWVLGDYLHGPWLAADAARQPLPMALDLHGLYEQLLRSLLPQPARAGESLEQQLERLAHLRSRQTEYRKLQARLHKERQFNRKVALNAQLRELQNEIDTLGA